MNPRVLFYGWLCAAAFAVPSEARALVFTRGPFVQNASTNRIQIIWRTSLPASTWVEYEATGGPSLLVTNATLETNHVVTLEGLEPNTAYFYRVGSERESEAVASAAERFRTLKTEGSVLFAVLGDTGGGNHPTIRLGSRMYRSGLDFDLVLDCGDVTYFAFTDMSVGAQCFGVFQRLMKRIPFYMAAGNHDITASLGGDPTGGQFRDAFYLPTNTADGMELFYSFDHGDAHFVCLYNPWPFEYTFSATNAQYAWLTNDLAASAKPWKIVFIHTPILSSGPHFGEGDQALQLLLPLAQQYGVQMVFGGHDHDFERFAPTNGLHSCVTGGGGNGLYLLYYPQPASAQFWSVYHYLAVAITNDTMTIRAIGSDGLEFDSMTVQKALPPSQLYQASWHTPEAPLGPANDGDGNVIGQTFDLTGAPILPRAGQFSNLGRVYVNNDATSLYIGFEQVMTYPDNTVFFFIESPRQPGVSTLAGLGNGVLDPDGQGADGLDCLENLSFAGFSPGVGCILGDEYGDGQFRSFSRWWWFADVGLNTGQGVFRLDESLSTVPGVQLQQFNRSPQLTQGDTSTEQGADLITMAIPFTSLGGLQPGETIKLGAVVGGGAYDAAAQTRFLDTSVLGCSLSGSGLSNVVLEGVTVRLARDPRLRLTIVPVNVGAYQLAWNAQVGQAYDIEYSNDLSDFARLTDPKLPVTATSPEATFVVTPPPSQVGFYRLRVVP